MAIKSSLKQHIFNPFPNILSLKINMIMYSLGASNMKTDSKIKTYAKKKKCYALRKPMIGMAGKWRSNLEYDGQLQWTMVNGGDAVLDY